jgi:CubicO group peptidase (beta-lactamase class C family)
MVRLLLAVVAMVVPVLSGCSPSGSDPTPGPTRPDLAAAVDRFVDQNQGIAIRNRRAILVSVHGETLVERYYDSAEETAPVASVTKSVVSTLVGIAVSQGLLTVDQTVGELLPSHRASMSAQVAGITVRQLLTMTAGLPGDGRSDPAPRGEDWVEEILRNGTARPPGSGFAYSSVSSHLLAAILAEVTGRPVLSYAREVLFDPLGIDTTPVFQPLLAPDRPRPEEAYAAAGFAWPRDPQGVHVGFGYLKLSAEDMMRIGTLFLRGGAWEGRQVVPREWVEAATSPLVSTDRGFGGDHYGYQWWVSSAGGHSAFAAIGYGGQIIEVVPDLDLVVVASTWIDDVNTLDSSTWQYLVTTSLVPELERAAG